LYGTPSFGTPQFVNVQRSPGARLRAGVATEAGYVAASAKSTPPVAVWGAQIWSFSPQMAQISLGKWRSKGRLILV
jgi:hypothetical protein